MKKKKIVKKSQDKKIKQDEKQPDVGFLKKIFNVVTFNFFKAKKPKVAVVSLNGVLSHNSSFSGGSTLNIANTENKLKKAFEMKNIKAVAICINSPGGSPVQSDLIFNRIKELAKENEVKLYTFAEEVAASGGYWLLVAGEKIFATKNSIVGSIGVVSSGFGFVDTIKKIGVERRVYTIGKNKSMLDPFKPEKKDDVDFIKNLMGNINENFIEHVKDNRKKKLKAKDDDVFNGKFWLGKEAKDLGLIDEIGDYRSIFKNEFGDDVEFVLIDEPKTWLQRKFGMFSPKNLIDYLIVKIEEKIKLSQFGL